MLLVQGARPPSSATTKCSWSRASPPRISSTKWTLSLRRIHLGSHPPRRISSEARIYQVMGSPPKSRPVKGFVPLGIHPPR
ncbi:hypothetical protein ACOSP7_007191 [Xanthoceras sorbifolium]